MSETESEGAAAEVGEAAAVGAGRASKVQEAAAQVREAARAVRRQASSGNEAERVARAYFEKIAARELDAAVAMWAPGGREHVLGLVDVAAPEGVREFIGELLRALPDMKMEVLSTTSEGDRCAVQWRLSGTFAGPGKFNGLAPTGDPVLVEGVDLIAVRDGLIQSNDAYQDTMTLPREIGMMPGRGSAAEQRMIGAFNLKTKLSTGVSIREAGLIAEGVWVVQGQPGRCNVYLIEDGDGVTMFDAGARMMVRSVASAAAKLGGLQRIVLGHGHTDHRGVAPSFEVPVLCHPAEVQDAEGSGGFRYWPAGLAGLPAPQRQIHQLMHRMAWDGGPVKIANTLKEGDEVAGFRVIDLPGHAPGQIGLWREADRVALTTDCFYTLDMWGRNSPPHLPDRVYNYDTEQARQSILKLAALEPAAAWPGHAEAITGDVRRQLEAAAKAG
ncbi:MAG TPA: ester cyclase [Solirubrobacteraceae bacterium]|jgi:glyoxylase-like metal-dependent hydrolase (beta-lactamase superfamily II)/predicted ester cyclase